LKQRLAQVPGFEEYSRQLDQMAEDSDEGGPVETVWKLLRTGHPLLVIYNALEPEKRLAVEDMPNTTDEKLSKIAIMKFYQACLNDLKLPPAESFMIKDLTGSDTTGFVKVRRSDIVSLECFFGTRCYNLWPPLDTDRRF
jgi:cell division control protein 24